jgi:hypothetical protein
MRTDELIATLSGQLEPVKTGAVTRTLLGALVLGLTGSVLVMLLALGPRHDLAAALSSFGLWLKLAYTFAIAGFGFWLVERAGRPGASFTFGLRLLILPALVIIAVALAQLMAPGADVPDLVMGHSARVCPFLVVMVSLPTLIAAFWALRQLAPTRLTLAGALAGLFAGGAGAFVYAFHCPETAAPFVALWYSAGILLTAGLGALLGPRLLRW